MDKNTLFGAAKDNQKLKKPQLILSNFIYLYKQSTINNLNFHKKE